MENGSFEDVSPIEDGIFCCHVIYFTGVNTKDDGFVKAIHLLNN